MKYCIHCMQPRDQSQSACFHCGKTGAYDAPVHHLKPGTILEEKYLVGKALGEGGFGITYIGRDLTLDIPIAVKEYYPNTGSSRNHNYSNTVTLTQTSAKQDYEKDLQRFLTEARILAKFSNEPGIVWVRDFFRNNGTAYIVMEYLDGITLKELIQTNGPVSMDQLMPMMQPVMKSLARLHQQGMIHRDISPDNIMVLNNRQLKLLDFGAAREVTGDKSLSVVLKPGYAPEEQYRSKGRQGAWTDVYALCATIYKCITGKTPDESLERIYEDHLLPPSELGASITTKQEAALMKGLSIRTIDRVQSVEDLLAELEPSASDGKIHGMRLSRIPEQDSEKTVYQPDAPATRYEPPTRYEPAEPATHYGVSTSYEPEGAATTREQKEVADEKPVADQPEKLVMRKNAPHEAHASSSEGEQKGMPKEAGKKKKGWLPAVIAVTVAVAALLIMNLMGPKETITAAMGDESYSITQVGQIEDFNRTMTEKGDVLYNRDGVPLTPAGELMYENPVDAVDYLGNGLYAVSEDIDSVNRVALVDQEGTVLIPAQACVIEWISTWNCGRYLAVYYAEEAVAQGETFLVCMDSNGMIYKSDVGGTLYNGYIRVFDTEGKQFVQNVSVPNRTTQILSCGNSFLVGDYNNGYTLYDASGSALLQIEGEVMTGDGIFVSRKDRTYYIHDETGKKTATLNQYIYPMAGSRFVKREEDDGYVIMDQYGNIVSSEVFENIKYESEGVFSVKKNGKWGLLSVDGTQIVPCQYDYLNALTATDGYYYASAGNRYTLLSWDGILMTDLDSSNYQMIYEQDGRILVINRRAYALERGDQRRTDLGVGLIALGAKDTGLYGVYDLFTGETLLPQVYEEVICAADYLYAYRNGVWEVYEKTFSKGE